MNRLQVIRILLGAGAFVACVAALFVPWHGIDIEYDFSDSPATTDNPFYYMDQTQTYEFLVDEVWTSRTSVVSDGVVTRIPYYENYFPTVGGLFEKVGNLCYCSLALIASSTVGVLVGPKRLNIILTASAMGLLAGTLLAFSLSIPGAISDDIQRPFELDVDGLYGSQEGVYVDEYIEYTWKAEWNVSSAWWLVAVASLMVSAHIILLVREVTNTKTMRIE